MNSSTVCLVLCEQGGLPLAFWQGVNAIMGAALGASFYVLLKTQPFLVTRSFDPKYNAAYISRFITGVIGGVILAIAIGPEIGKKTDSTSVFALTPGILAILGGYAAEAVEQILQRLVEVLLATVRGDGSAQAQAKAAAEQAAKTAKLQEQLPDLEAARGNDAEFKAALERLRATLRKSAT
jgi:hypothetical protein